MLEKLVRDYTPGDYMPVLKKGRGAEGRGISNSVQSPRRFRHFPLIPYYLP